jgi:hypothetical protein
LINIILNRSSFVEKDEEYESVWNDPIDADSPFDKILIDLGIDDIEERSRIYQIELSVDTYNIE